MRRLALCVLLAACPKKEAPKVAPPVDAAFGGIEVMTFDRPEDAFETVLKDDPSLLAIGEAHAQRNTTVPSSAKRFTDALLPLLAGRASDLLVELMMPPTGCVKHVETMRSVQKPVVTQQAEGNQNEYIAMGEAARKLGIVPDLLRPGCDDLAAINDAGEDAIPRSLETIARLTTKQASKMLERSGRKMVVTYGGALHNDAHPPPERASWSYGPALSQVVPGRYVELDLYIPELITGDESWQKQAWYGDWEKNKASGKVVLFRLAAKDYVLVFAPTR
jgi:hypothetical protein